MKKRLLVLAGLTAVLAGYPLLNESAGNSCSALEKRWYTVSNSKTEKSLVESAVIRSFLEAGDGLFASEYARKEYPEIPPILTCYFYYWRSILNEKWLRDIKPSLLSDYHGLRERRLAKLGVG